MAPKMLYILGKQLQIKCYEILQTISNFIGSDIVCILELLKFGE